MGYLSMTSALAAWVVAFPWPAPVPPQLSSADTGWVAKTYAEAVEFGRAGKWGQDEAQAPVRKILDLCTRKLGKDHYETANYRREIETLKKLAGLPEADRLEYRKTYKLSDEIEALSNRRKHADALAPAEEMLRIYRRLLGPGSYYEGLVALQYGQLLRSCERYSEAEGQFRAALKIFRTVVGDDHPQTIAAYCHLANQVDRLGGTAEAERLHKTALDIARRLLGDGHAMTAVARNNLAGHFDRLALYTRAEPLYRQALDALRAAHGEDGPLVPMARNNLAVTLNGLGKYAEGERELRRALVTQRKTAGADDLDVALFCANLGVNLDAQARHTEAEHLHRTALDTWVRALGAEHTRVAEARSNLAVNLDYQGKYAEGEAQLDMALRIFRALPRGEESLGAAGVYSNLASCLQGQGKHTAAQAAAEKALAIFRARLAADHPKVAVAYNNLASSLQNQDRYAETEPHFRTALAALRGRLGEGHPDTAHAHSNLSINLYYQGRFADAHPHLQSALDSFRRRLGEGHPRTAWTYKSLIGNSCARGDYAAAAALADLATASFEAARLRLGFAGLDRALRTPDVSPLPGLAVAAARRGHRDDAWKALERNLSRGLLDHIAAGPLTPDERKRELALLEKIHLLDRRFDELMERRPPVEAARWLVLDAELDRNAAQAELVRFQAGLAEKHGVRAGQVYPLAHIQKHIPDDAALVAWVDLPHVPNWHDRAGDHWACLVKRTGAPVWVQLAGTGPEKAWTKDDDQLAARFRASINERRPREDWKDLRDRLARQRLGPLDDHLAGVRHLIVLPSSAMAGLPVDALTDRTVSYAPSGTMFAWLRERRMEAGAKAPARTLLALGDPAYRPAADAPAELPGSRQELAGIARVFDQSTQLMGPRASEQTLDRLAAEDGGLRRFGYLHFATHGVLDDRRPMRSALLLAQDPLPDPLTQVLDGKDAPDGRLTAERILRRWNRQLDAELVTLSACQTGLGTYSGGEGYLGFSQALFLAGARSLVLSLWEVDDTATALLMTRFYENLMGLPKGVPGGPVAAKPKAEALAEAKQWLRSLGPEQVQQLAEGLPRLGTRGRIVKKAAAVAPVRSFDHPYYWSGFILIGDPG